MNTSLPRKPDKAADSAADNARARLAARSAGEPGEPSDASGGEPVHPGLEASGAAAGEPLMAGGSLVGERLVGESHVFPVISEVVEVGTVSERSGTVRVRKVVHEVSEPVSAPGYREVIETLRVPLNQVVQAVQPPWQQGDVLVVPVYEERLVRQLVLLEELHIKRRREPLDNSASVSLRREEVIVERLDPQTGQWVREEPS